MTHYDSLGPGVFTYLDCSTVHITEEDDGLLYDMSDSNRRLFYKEQLLVATPPDGYGHWVYVDNEATCLSGTLSQIMRLAHQKGCQWVRFSSDGTVFDDLPKYEW